MYGAWVLGMGMQTTYGTSDVSSLRARVATSSGWHRGRSALVSLLACKSGEPRPYSISAVTKRATKKSSGDQVTVSKYGQSRVCDKQCEGALGGR